MNPILETKGLTFIYSPGTAYAKVACDHVDVTLYEGEFLGVIGHTAAAKVP